jgi:hypothetical protein
VAALLATQAAFEASADPASPIMAVVGSELMRQAVFQPGERKDVPSEKAVMRLRLVVLDFTAPATAANGARK